MSNWNPLNEHFAMEGYDSEGIEALEDDLNTTLGVDDDDCDESESDEFIPF